MKIRTFTTIVLILVAFSYLAGSVGAVSLEWEKLLGNETKGNTGYMNGVQMYSDFKGYALIPSEDGYLIIGTISAVYDDNILLIKTDKEGNLLWQRMYGGKYPGVYGPEEGRQQGYAGIQVRDGYLICGYADKIDNYDGNPKTYDYSDIWILRLDRNGNVLWNMTVGDDGPNDQQWCRGVAPAQDGYILAGYTRTDEKPDYDGYLVKIDGKGNVIWEKRVPLKSEDSTPHWNGFETIKPDGNGYILTGLIDNSYGWLVKIDDDGNVLWEKEFSSPTKKILDAEPIGDGYTLTGFFGNQGLLSIVDSSGKVLWEKGYPSVAANRAGMFSHATFNSVKFLGDGYALTGTVHLSESDKFPYIVILNSRGEMVWNNTKDTITWNTTIRSSSGEAHAVVEDDNSIVVVGTANGRVYLAKVSIGSIPLSQAEGSTPEETSSTHSESTPSEPQTTATSKPPTPSSPEISSQTTSSEGGSASSGTASQQGDGIEFNFTCGPGILVLLAIVPAVYIKRRR
ncbi:hypothetical protein JCM16138_04990 [Thermococcus atlanticus]